LPSGTPKRRGKESSRDFRKPELGVAVPSATYFL
jgi:hypothetical protein